MIELPKTRKDVPEGCLWKPEHIYKTQEDWEADFAYVKENAAKLAECTGTLKDGCAAVLNALRIYAEAGEHLSRLYTYAATNLNSDNSDSFYQGLIARAQSLATQFYAASAFLQPELLSLPEETLEAYIADPDFADFDVYPQGSGAHASAYAFQRNRNAAGQRVRSAGRREQYLRYVYRR